MLISQALAFDAGIADTGSAGGGIALLIILGVGILLFTGYSIARRRRHKAKADDGK